MTTASDLLSRPFGTISAMIATHAKEQPASRALSDDMVAIDYADLDLLMNSIAAGLARDVVTPGTSVAIVGATTVRSTIIFLGILRAGGVPAPIAPSATAAQTAAMVADCGAPLVFADADVEIALPSGGARRVDIAALDDWLAPGSEKPTHEPKPEDRFNIIYSSGTSGTPKGIIHSHAMRWAQVRAYAPAGFADAITMVATPLYSNTTLVSLLPTLAYGGTAVLLGKFDAQRFVSLAARERATHAMLVPVQYQRIMALPGFDAFDLSSFRVKTCTSAPFSPELKEEVIRRWPGMLVELYGMTEGGGICLLYANMFPDKLHTVGQPAPGHDIRLIDEAGNEVAQGQIGEVVGRSPIMMSGYHGRASATDETMWHDAEGNRFIRHGDLGRFDEDGFLTLLGRSKDLIISGGFNIYPSDLEEVLMQHPDVMDAAVIGVPSEAWGETPYAFYVASDDAPDPSVLIDWVNARVGRTQRLSGAEPIAELPRSVIGKVLKRDLRARFDTASTSNANGGELA